MLLDWVIGPFLGVVNLIMGSLPTADLSWLPGTSTGASTGGWLAEAEYFLPLQPMLVIVLVLIGIVLPAFVVFELAQWAYRELPEIMGFGS
jgi:hypothetical protein